MARIYQKIGFSILVNPFIFDQKTVKKDGKCQKKLIFDCFMVFGSYYKILYLLFKKKCSIESSIINGNNCQKSGFLDGKAHKTVKNELFLAFFTSF